MGNRPILQGAATVEVDLERYDELVRKETMFDMICNAYARTFNLTDKEGETEE